jgi:UDPglucose 6-dehydrogenase
VKVGVFGTGYVGLVTAVCFAELGHTVTAVDKDEEVIAKVAAGIPPFSEPGLEELLTRNLARGRLTFTTRAEDVGHAEVVFLCVGTPPQADGSCDPAQLEEVARTLARILDGYKLIVEKSTVPVKTAYLIDRTIRRLAPARNFEVASNPEFLREGFAIHDFLHPDRVVIGADSERARTLLLELYGKDFECPILVTDVKTAELIKHTANAYLATKISFINIVANLCDEIGVDVVTVAKGVGLDNRIGTAFLNAGLGFGGSCLPKDLKAFLKMASQVGVDFSLLREVERINEQRVERLLGKVEQAVWVVREKTIGVLGLAFKPETDDIREAPSLKVIPRLKAQGALLRVYDPQAARNFGRIHPPDDQLTYVLSPYEAATGADVLLVLTDWDEFRSLDFDRLRSLMRSPVMVDGRNLFSAEEMRHKGIEYYSLGRGDATHSVGVSAIGEPSFGT